MLTSVAAILITVASIISLTSSFGLLSSWFNNSMQSNVRRIARKDLSSTSQFISMPSKKLGYFPRSKTLMSSERHLGC
jgi:hypothetical protein